MEGRYLIAGLGNPGKTYEGTRHNMGFWIVKALGSKYGITFKPNLASAKGNMGEGVIRERKVNLLMPLTYVNGSGSSIRRCSQFYEIPNDHLIVIADDVALPLGQIRLRARGSSGGHNGLKSIEAHLRTQEYPRLRIGVGNSRNGHCLSEYVVGHFTREEQQILAGVVDEAISVIELWMSSGIEAAMQEANRSN